MNLCFSCGGFGGQGGAFLLPHPGEAHGRQARAPFEQRVLREQRGKVGGDDGAGAALAGDEFVVAVVDLEDEDGVDKALILDAEGEFAQGVRVEGAARLPARGLDCGYVEFQRVGFHQFSSSSGMSAPRSSQASRYTSYLLRRGLSRKLRRPTRSAVGMM